MIGILIKSIAQVYHLSCKRRLPFMLLSEIVNAIDYVVFVLYKLSTITFGKHVRN